MSSPTNPEIINSLSFELSHVREDKPWTILSVTVGILLFFCWLPAFMFISNEVLWGAIHCILLACLVWQMIEKIRYILISIILDKQGKLTEAVIVERWVEFDDGVQYDPEEYEAAYEIISYYLIFTFQAVKHDGTCTEFMKGQYETGFPGKTVYNRVQVGDRVRVRYLPKNPKIVRIECR